MPTIRGDSARRNFVKLHEIFCTSHTVLMFGQQKRCVCGSPITEDYYTFAYRKINSQEDFHIMHAGPQCGKQIIKEAGIISSPLTNPFNGDVLIEHVERKIKNNTNEVHTINITHLNREMLQAVSLLFGIWGGPREGFIQRGLIEIMTNPTIDIPPQFIRALNKAAHTTLCNDAKFDEHLSLRENFKQLATKHGRSVRNLQFDKLQEALEARYAGETFYL